MAFWKNLIGGLFGGGKTTEKAMEIADEAFHTEQEKADTDQKDLSDARAMQMATHNSFIDVIVDAINRLIRPWLTVEVAAMMLGYRPVPDLAKVDDFWKSLFYIIVTFWFSGRVLLKDLPSVIKALRAK